MSNNTGILNALAIAETKLDIIILSVDTVARVVLAERQHDYEPYVTWKFMVEDNSASFYYGHYYSDAELAKEGYTARVAIS